MDAYIYINEKLEEQIKDEGIFGDSADLTINGIKYVSFGYPITCREVLVDHLREVQNLIVKTSFKNISSFSEPTYICIIDEVFSSEYKPNILRVAKALFNNKISWVSLTISGDCLFIGGTKFIEVAKNSIMVYYYPGLTYYYNRDCPLLSLLLLLIRNVDFLKGKIEPEHYIHIFNALDIEEKDEYGFTGEEDDEDYDGDYDYLSSREVLLSVFGYWYSIKYSSEFSNICNTDGIYFNGIASLASTIIGRNKNDVKRFLEFLTFIGNPQVPAIQIEWFQDYFTVEQLKKLVGG